MYLQPHSLIPIPIHIHIHTHTYVLSGAPQNHWFGPAGDPRAAGIGTPEAIKMVRYSLSQSVSQLVKDTLLFNQSGDYDYDNDYDNDNDKNMNKIDIKLSDMNLFLFNSNSFSSPLFFFLFFFFLFSTHHITLP